MRNFDHDIHQIRRALHDPRGARASVMVGSGFSFNAQKRFASAANFPTWRNITESLVARLYPEDLKARKRALENSGAVSGALRIAQEFQAAFGRNILINHLRDLLPDLEHDPGEVHRELLRLTWQDVFTTNYDTLLERASRGLRSQKYEIVRGVADLPLKRRPRIVKLHGTLPDLSHCILTEEDFRTYPQIYAPLVAEVQVSLVESHLCLVGFSGDDPNFLAWSGWVRDRLGANTLPIYLWTFNETTEFQRRLFEQRSIISLPLLAITGKKNPHEALVAFIERLAEPFGKECPRWCLPRRLTHHKQLKEPTRRIGAEPATPEEWFEAAKHWRNSRLAYPKWLIPHKDALENLWDATDTWASVATDAGEGLRDCDAPTRVFILHELVWRISLSLFPLYDALARSVVDPTLSDYSAWRASHAADVVVGVGAATMTISTAEIDAAAVRLQLERLRHARETGEFATFSQLLQTIEASCDRENGVTTSHIRDACTYERILYCLSTWNEKECEALLAHWKTTGAPLWALRRAGIYAELSNFSTAEQILSEALREIQIVADEGDSETWSIESWIVYALQRLAAAKEAQSRYGTGPSEKQSPDTIASASQDTTKVPYGVDAYGVHLRGAASESTSVQVPNREQLQNTLDWLEDHECYPHALLSWLHSDNSRHHQWSGDSTWTHRFEPRRWTTTHSFNGKGINERHVAAYRAMRLIEVAGIPLRYDNIVFEGALYSDALRFLSDVNAVEAPGLIMRSRDKAEIALWFTRFRIVQLPVLEVERLFMVARTAIGSQLEAGCSFEHGQLDTRRLQAALELMSRAATKASDETLASNLEFVISLSDRLDLARRWWLVDDVATLVSRFCDALSTESFYRALPHLMSLPFPGTKGWPSGGPQSRWSDPVRLLDRRTKLEKHVRNDHLTNAIDRNLARLGDADVSDSERKALVLRFVSLADRELLDQSQKQRLADILFARTGDKDGMPVATGCLDSVTLLFPVANGVDEYSLFRNKYILQEWPTDNQGLLTTLETLVRTVRDPDAPSERREILWSDSDLITIAKRCQQCVSMNCERLKSIAIEESIRSHPFRAMAMDERDWAEMICEQVAHIFDSLLLSRQELPKEAWIAMSTTLHTAKSARLSMLLAYPKLVRWDASYGIALIDDTIELLHSANEDFTRDALAALNHWANQLSDPKTPAIPSTVLACISGRLDGDYTAVSIHYIDTVRNLLRRLPADQAADLLRRCESALKKWRVRLRYTGHPAGSDPESRLRQERPDLRAAATTLCLTANARALSLEWFGDWLSELRVDGMPETRRAFEELGEIQPSGTGPNSAHS